MNVLFFFSGRGKLRINETVDAESVDTGARLYVEIDCMVRTITSYLYIGVSFVVVHSTKLEHADIRK
jgi:hypothetical protein